VLCIELIRAYNKRTAVGFCALVLCAASGVSGERRDFREYSRELAVLDSRDEPNSPAAHVPTERMDPAEKERFEVIALPHLDAVYRVARVLASDNAEADDLVQETFVRAFRAFGRFELREYGAKPWLLRIMYNVFYTLKGKQRRELALHDDADFDHFADCSDGAGFAPITAETINWDHFDEEVKTAIERLPAEYRAALLLWSIEGLSYKEIAHVCDCALGTVMSRLHRARRSLALHLGEYARRRKLGAERLK
jgi:RNA polymerase sigma-70 factor (ECF subfamily)